MCKSLSTLNSLFLSFSLSLSKSDGFVVLINRACNINLIGTLMRNHPLDTLTASVPALTATNSKHL